MTLFPDKGKAFEKWSKIVDSACFEVKVNTVLENTNLKEGDDIADLVIAVKTEKFCKSLWIVKILSDKNDYFSEFIKEFKLVALSK